MKTSQLCQVKHESMGTYDLCEFPDKSPQRSDEVDHRYVYSLTYEDTGCLRLYITESYDTGQSMSQLNHNFIYCLFDQNYYIKLLLTTPKTASNHYQKI